MTGTDKIALLSFGVSALGLLVALLAGFLTPFAASTITLTILVLAWMGWITARVLHLSGNSARKTAETTADIQNPKTLPYPPFYAALNDHVMKIDNRLKKVKIPAAFLSWKSFTILFWAEITEEIFVASHNKYLFSYTTDVTDSSHHPNQFSLGLQGRTTRWRFVLKGSDPKNSTEINFSSGLTLLGWHLFSIRWDQTSRKLDFAIDVGHVFRDDSRQVPASHWPEGKNGHLFHLGGWQDNWDGGLSEIRFFNFLVFQKWLSSADLETVLNKERALLKPL